MAGLEMKVTVPRRQAMLDIYEDIYPNEGRTLFRRKSDTRVPVFVWPIPTLDGCFIIEHQDGRCQKVQPYELTFLGSKEFFDQYDWRDE